MQTKNLTVHSFDYAHLGDTECGMRRMYVATFTDIDWPGPVVTACVWLESFDGPYLDWIETTEGNRLKGYAAELLTLLDSIHPGLVVDGVTPAGEAFLDSLGVARG